MNIACEIRQIRFGFVACGMSIVNLGRHFLQLPGPNPVPERVQRAMSAPVIDHRGPEFKQLALDVLAGIRGIFRTTGPVVIYPSSGTGAWEAAIVNTLSPGDEVLMCETGHFAAQWAKMAAKWGLKVHSIPGDWRHGADPAKIEQRLREDGAGAIKAVMVVHNETSTGVTSRVADIRKAMDAAGHEALFMVDTISSLGSVEFNHDAWGVDVAICCSQKGLMLPPGLGFTAISEKALAASRKNTAPRSYWDWAEMMQFNKDGFFPYTPATTLLYGLRESIAMLNEEGLDAVFARHQLLAEATRAAVDAWGLEIVCRDPGEHSPVLTAILMPEGHGADRFRAVALDTYNISLGSGLSRLADKVFRIGHLGECNAPTLVGALGAVELALHAAGVPHRPGGVSAALDVFRGQAAVA